MAMAQKCIDKYRPRGFTGFDRNMRVGMEYVAVQKNKTASAINRRMTFERFGDFLLADFFEGLHIGYYPLQCGVCKRYFLQMTAHQRKYCNGYAPNDPKGRSCEAFAARSNRLAKELSTNKPLNEPYNTRRGMIDKHYSAGKSRWNRLPPPSGTSKNCMIKPCLITNISITNTKQIWHRVPFMRQLG